MTPANPPQYLKYDGAAKTEREARGNRTALPHRFRMPASASTDAAVLSGVCFFPAAAPDAPPFWFDFSGKRLAGEAKHTMPSEYFVSPVGSARGLRIQGSFGGAATGSGVLYETAYFHEQVCDAGGLEFGFYRNVIAGQTVFYISNNSNCGIQPKSYCHAQDTFASDYMNEDNYAGQALTTNVNGWVIKNLTVGGAAAPFSNLSYAAWVEPDPSAPHGFHFQIGVLNPATSSNAVCDIEDSRGRSVLVKKPCRFAARPEGWYRIDKLAPGYVTVGIQRQGSPQVQTPVDFKVERVSVRR